MLNVDELKEAIAAIVIALAAGAGGGLVSELILQRGKGAITGVLVLPSRRGQKVKLGSLAAVLVGALAGIAAAALLLPIENVAVGAVTERQIDWIRILGVGLVAGAAGQAFWAALTKGLTAADYNARLESVLATLKAKEADEAGGAPPPQLSGAIAAVEQALRDAP